MHQWLAGQDRPVAPPRPSGRGFLGLPRGVGSLVPEEQAVAAMCSGHERDHKAP